MRHILVPALPISLLWVAVTGRVEWGSLLVGYVIGVITLAVLSALGIRFLGSFTLRQLIAVLRYSVLLFW
ncbi:MAG: hypothetical protein IAE80_25190, partial [Anaerolinea sp.]|nr:hypothetical protein [Anaerolinea sp.]